MIKCDCRPIYSIFSHPIYLFLFMMTFFLHACMSSLIHETGPQHQALLDKNVNQIENISLLALSQNEPVSIDKGTQRQQAQAREREMVHPSIPLSLTDIRSAALANNLELKVELVNPTLAKEKWQEERAKFEAAFFGGIRYSNSQTPTASQLVGSQSTNMYYEAGIRQPLPTGGELTISQPGNRYETDNQYSTLNPSFETDLQFSLSQPLLRGAGANTNTHSIRVARLNQKITDAETKLQAIRILAETDRAYWNVYGASMTLEVSQQQYQIAVRQLEEAKLRVKSGSAPKIEITRAESGEIGRAHV